MPAFHHPRFSPRMSPRYTPNAFTPALKVQRSYTREETTVTTRCRNAALHVCAAEMRRRGCRPSAASLIIPGASAVFAMTPRHAVLRGAAVRATVVGAFAPRTQAKKRHERYRRRMNAGAARCRPDTPAALPRHACLSCLRRPPQQRSRNARHALGMSPIPIDYR